MRNLKRALSLGLTAAMISGLMVMDSSAASYADVTSENNQEAIDVLQTVGIMVGDENGNFNPDQNVTRNEMAVIMANLMEYNVATYKDTSPFTDVPSWAEPYVAACYTNGITSGYSDTIYGGSDTVTTAQAALMLMKALGYFQYASDFGSDWQLATTRQGNAIDLFVGVDSGVTAPMTRDDVAQLVLNTLESGTVTASTDGSWSIGDVTIVNNVKYDYVTSGQPYATAIDDRNTNNDGDLVNGHIVELGEQLYMGDLKLNDKTSDDFERPSRTWSYDGAEIGTYMKDELIVATYTTGVTGRELYDLLTSATIKEYGFASYLDGGAGSIEKNDLVRSNNDDLDDTGNGVLTQVFLDLDDKEITVTSINTWLAKANNDYNEDSETLSVRIFDDEDNGSDGSTGYSTQVLDVADVPEIEGVAADQYLLVNQSIKDRNKLEVVAISDPEILTGATVTKFSTDKDSDEDESLFDSLTADGTAYSSSEKALYNKDVLNLYDQALLTDMTYNVFLDPYGYAIGVELHEGDLNYVFIAGYDLNSSNITRRTAEAAAIFTDGTMDVITVNVTNTNRNLEDRDHEDVVDAKYDGKYDFWGDNGVDGDPQVNRWFTYTEVDGVYTLKPVDDDRMLVTDYNEIVDADDTEVINCSNVDVRDNGRVIEGGMQLANPNPTYERGFGNDDSVYITVEPGDVDNAPVDGAITDVTGVYTGVQDVDIEMSLDTKANVPNYVYTLVDDDQYIIASIVLGEAQGSVANFALITDAPISEELRDGVYYWEFEAVMGGTEQVLTARSRYQDAITFLSNHERDVVELRFDADNYVVDADPVDIDVSAFTEKIVDGDELFDVDTANDKAGVINQLNPVDLYLTGRTLHTGSQSHGLTFITDAPTVLEQQINGKWVTREYANVQEAYNDLADADPYTADLQFCGRIVAVLNDREVADWVYIKSYTPINGSDAGYDDADSITNGDVTLTVADPLADPKSVRMTRDGKISYSFQYVAPAAAARAVVETDKVIGVNYTEAVVVNGTVDQVKRYKGVALNTNNMVYGTTSAEIDNGDEVVVRIYDVEPVYETVVVEDKTYTLTLSGDFFKEAQVWLDGGNTAAETGTVTATGTPYIIPANNATVTITGVAVDSYSEDDIIIVGGVQFKVVELSNGDKALEYTMTGSTNVVADSAAETVTITIDNVAYVIAKDADKVTVPGMADGTRFMADGTVTCEESVLTPATNAKGGVLTMSDTSKDRTLYTACKVDVTDADGNAVKVYLDTEKKNEAKAYVAKGQTVYFTLTVGETYMIDGTETLITEENKNQAIEVSGDIKVTYYETKEAFEANVEKALKNINLDGDKKPAEGINMSFDKATNTLSVAIDMAEFGGGLDGGTQNTGTMNALEALYEAGYTVTLKRDGKQAITLTEGTDAEYKATILSYISDLVGMKGATNEDTITVTINGLNGNSMTGYVELSITVPAN